jgi:hypothetical protein
MGSKSIGKVLQAIRMRACVLAFAFGQCLYTVQARLRPADYAGTRDQRSAILYAVIQVELENKFLTRAFALEKLYCGKFRRQGLKKRS